jgi:hypothetical protein
MSASIPGVPKTTPVDDPIRAALAARVLAFIQSSGSDLIGDTHPPGSTGDTHLGWTRDTHSPDATRDTHSRRDALLGDLARYQSSRVAPYAQLCAAQVTSLAEDWAPALPTDVFRYARVSSFSASEDTHVFRTSGTSSGPRGVHAFRDLALYDAAAQAHARRMLFPDVDRMTLIMLAEHPARARESSLSYMLGRFEAWFSTAPATWCLRDGSLDTDALVASIERSVATQTPVAILGTSFAFVFAEDALGDRQFALPRGSRIMQTGGYKGRSREVEPAALREQLSRRYGLDEAYVVAEYGMTELSSQLYEVSLRDRFEGHPSPRRHLVAPAWVRATPVHPETLRPLGPDEVGVLRIDDAANLDSVSAILTSDIATRAASEPGGVFLLGRAAGANLRGCSLSVEEALGAPGDTHPPAAHPPAGNSKSSGDTHS